MRSDRTTRHSNSKRRVNVKRRVAAALKSVAAWDWSPADDVINVSTTVKSVFGVRRIRGIEQGLTIVAPDDRERQRRLLDAAVASGTGYSSEFQIVRPDTHRRSTLREYAEAILDPNGEAVRLIGVDIEQRARRGALLCLIEELASTLVAREAMRWRDYTAGLRARKPHGRWTDIYQQYILRLAACATSIDDFTTRVRSVTATQRRSSQRHVAALHARANSARRRRTRATPIAATATDTLRRLLERVVAAALERRGSPDAAVVLTRVCERLPCAAIVANDAGEFVAANAAASELTGYSRSELLRLSVWQITPGVHEREAETLWRAFRERREQSGEYRVLTKEGYAVIADYVAQTNVLPGLHVSLLQPAKRPPSYG